MKRRSFTIACVLAFSAPVLAQQGGAPQRHYARAYYTKWKPGMQNEGQAFLKDVPYKASLNWLKSEPSAVGQITMSRVLPGGSEISHDRLRLVVISAPPGLSGRGSPGSPQYVESLGMSHAAYTAKLHDSVTLAVYPDSESAFKSFGGQQEVFSKAHPSKYYHTCREAYDAAARAATSVSSVVYRADLAAWK